MYYSRITGKLIFDATDSFLLSMILSLYFCSYLKYYFSEEQKMRRLRKDLIRRAKLVKSSKSSSKLKSFDSIKRLKKVIKIVNLTMRGGDNEVSNVLFKIGNKIDAFVLSLLAALENKISKDTRLKVIFIFINLYLRFILRVWKIRAITEFSSEAGKQKIIAMVMGTASGIGLAWLGVGLTLLAHLLAAGLISRSVYQQLVDIINDVRMFHEMKQFLMAQEMEKKRINMLKRIEYDKNQKRLLNFEDYWDKYLPSDETPIRLGLPDLAIRDDIAEPDRLNIVIRTLELDKNITLNGSNSNNLKTLAKKLVDFKKDLPIIDDNFVSENPPIKIPFIRIRTKLKKYFLKCKIS